MTKVITHCYGEENIRSRKFGRHTSIDSQSENSSINKLIASARRLDPRKQLKPGSKRASTLTVITSMVGGGTLALPYAMQHAGFVPTLVYFVLFATMCSWSLYGLILVGQKTNANTFYDIAKALFGAKVAILIELLLVSILMLAAIAYLTMVKNLLPYSLRIIFNTGIDCFWTSKFFLIPALTLFFISPLALMRKVAALRYASLSGFCLVIYLTVITTTTFFHYCDKPYGHGCLMSSRKLPSVFMNVDLYGVDWIGHMYTIPLIISSFAAHPTVLPIYIELQKKSPVDMWVVMVTGLSIAAFFYMVLSSFGYLTFLSDTKPNYLLNEYHHNLAVTLASVGLCMVCVLAMPLFIQAKRRSITTLYFNHFTEEDPVKKPLLGNTQRTSEDVISNWDTAESESAFADLTMVDTPDWAFAKRRSKVAEVATIRGRANNQKQQELPIWANVIITYGFLIVEATVSLYASNIGAVLGILGATNFPACCYIFPAIALWKVRAKNPDDEDINVKLLILVTSSAVIVSGLGILGLLVQCKILT